MLAQSADVTASTAALYSDQFPPQLADLAGGRGLVAAGWVPVGVRLEAMDSQLVGRSELVHDWFCQLLAFG